MNSQTRNERSAVEIAPDELTGVAIALEQYLLETQKSFNRQGAPDSIQTAHTESAVHQVARVLARIRAEKLGRQVMRTDVDSIMAGIAHRAKVFAA